MQLYNALSQEVEPFEPIGEAVTVYVCGITPYDTTHIGHCFTYVSFDNLIRYLESIGYPVKYTQNVTDIDDDILRKAKEVGDDWLAVGNRWTAHFIKDNIALNVRPPDYFPRATDVIEEIVSAVQALLDAGVAYESNGSVYYSVAKDPDFGKLSRLGYDEMLSTANERGNRPDDPNKQDPLDFVLWQAHAPGEPFWESPWGKGRPGWHIECSTMSSKYLGKTIDIHGGGLDLLFPHHECEIVQAEKSTAVKPFSRFWMHTAMVEYEGEKMSKSLGNLVWVRELLEEGWPADAIRVCMAGHHYRKSWEYVPEDLEQAAEKGAKFLMAVKAKSGLGNALDAAPAENAFHDAMQQDLDTPAALAALVDLADAILAAAEAGRDITKAQQTFRTCSAVLGLRLDNESVEDRVTEGWNKHLQRFDG
jgi:L-cysteine:1D-myo-inositol 2-amino-2-deoxy-alpha-D-glucopyranoside ligase